MASKNQKQYDLVLLGATGYTGKLCAEHIATRLPTNLKWAVAGRTIGKLENIVDGLKSYNADRLQPGIEVATLRLEDLDRLTKTTRVILNTIGPYHLYSSPVVEACARNGTHYLDVTGETPWVFEMIQKYHTIARANGAIIIPEIGIESAPSDMLAWSLATLFRREFSLATREVICTIHRIKLAPSGGTLATVLGVMENYRLSDIGRSTKPWALSPTPGPPPSKKSWITKIFGVRWVPELGTLTTSVMGATNRAIVQRSWGILDDGNYYGPNFQYSEHITARNTLIGVAMHFAFVYGMIAIMLPPFRWLVKKFIYAPGEGRSKDDTTGEAIEFRAIATADGDTDEPKRASARFRYDGGGYYLTGLLLAEAAMVLIQDTDIVERQGGGVLTPAVLGQSFIDRVQAAGVEFETRLLPP